jgi:pyridoxamine 5'-phosphate oxidase
MSRDDGEEFPSAYPQERQAEDFTAAGDPLVLFEAWFKEAEAAEPSDPNAMALATASPDGVPNVRMVLLKGLDAAGSRDRGFVFYTNLESPKGRELLANPRAALLFHWKSLRRQVRVRGPVTVVPDAEADAYFASRPRGSRLGAWASQQSRPLEGRLALEKALARYAATYAVGAIPRPPYWSGFRLTPLELEFWHDRPYRLHDRVRFTRASPSEAWARTQLYP